MILSIIGCDDSERRIDVDGFSVTVVDRVTQQPIEGVLVIASFIARSGSHDSMVGLSNGLETLTGKDGIAHFPAWSTTGPGFGEHDPVLVAYKTGYMTIDSSTKSVRKRNGSIFHVASITPQGLTTLPLMKCEDTTFEISEECDSKAYDIMMRYIGPAQKNLTKLPLLSKVIEENR